RCAQQRTWQAFVALPFPHRAIGSDAHIIVAPGRLRRNIAGVEIALDQVERALGRRPVAAATSGLDTNEIARREPEAFLLPDRSHCAGLTIHNCETAGRALFSVLHAPGRKTRTVKIGLQFARSENAIALAKAEPAAELAGAARILS